MKRVIKSKVKYKDFLGEEFKIVVDATLDFSTDSVKATLNIYKEIISAHGTYIQPIDSLTPRTKTYDLATVTALETALNLPSTLNFVEVQEKVKLATILNTIEVDKLFIINEVELKAIDFEESEVNELF